MMMGNHYHLFVETPEANLIEGMKWLQNTYTRRFEALQREAPSVGKGVRGPLQVRGGGGRIARVPMGAWWITSTLTRRGLVLLAPAMARNH